MTLGFSSSENVNDATVGPKEIQRFVAGEMTRPIDHRPKNSACYVQSPFFNDKDWQGSVQLIHVDPYYGIHHIKLMIKSLV